MFRNFWQHDGLLKCKPREQNYNTTNGRYANHTFTNGAPLCSGLLEKNMFFWKETNIIVLKNNCSTPHVYMYVLEWNNCEQKSKLIFPSLI